MKLKKAFVGVALLTLLTFTSCKKSEASRPELDFDYTCDAQITFDEQLYKTEISRNGSEFRFIYTYPAELSGMTVSLNDENMKISFNGLEMENDRDSVPDSCVCDFIAKALNYITYGSGMDFMEKSGIITAKGRLDGSDISVTYDKNGLPEKISLGTDIEATFENFKKAQKNHS